MGNEVEVKFRVTAARAEEMRVFMKLHATGTEQIHQKDSYFETGSKTALRIRNCNGLGNPILTVKGPTTEVKGVKTREEVEVGFHGHEEKLSSALALLGFKPSVVVTKTRVAGNFHGFEIAVDDVKGAGYFIELEAKNDFAVATIEQMITYLNLDGEERVKEGYKDLVR